MEGLGCQEGCRLERVGNWKTWTRILNQVCIFSLTHTHTPQAFSKAGRKSRVWQSANYDPKVRPCKQLGLYPF